MLQAASTKTQAGGLPSSPQFHFSKFNSLKVVDCSQLQAGHQSFTLSQQERNCVIFVLFFLSLSLSRCHPAVLVPILVLLGGPAVNTHYSPLPPLTNELNEHNPCLPVRSWESPTSKLGIWIIKVLFLASPLRATDLTLWVSPSPACTLSPHLSSLSISPSLCRSPICTRSSSRSRIRGRRLMQKTTTDPPLVSSKG